MLSRFLLNLREVAYGSNVFSTPSASREMESRSFSFFRMAGSLGNAVHDAFSGLADEEHIDEDDLGIEDDCITGGTAPMDIELEAVHQT